MMRRWMPPGELTAEQVMERAGYQLADGGVWRKGDRSYTTAVVNRIWEEDGPKKLALVVSG